MRDCPTITAITDVEGNILSSGWGDGSAGDDGDNRPFASGVGAASRSIAAKALRTAVSTGRSVVCTLRMLDGQPYLCEFVRLPPVGGQHLVSVKAWRTSDVQPTADTKYVALDVVAYSLNRSVEAQADIVAALNEIVRGAVARCAIEADRVIYIPTGDGIIIALLDLLRPYDIHVRLALAILEALAAANEAQIDPRRRFALRIAVNESVDTVVTDINGCRNVAGDGINIAARLMSAADGGNVLVGERVHQRLCAREAYTESFRAFRVTVKHGVELSAYQLVGTGLPFVNEAPPATLEAAAFGPDAAHCPDLCPRIVIN